MTKKQSVEYQLNKFLSENKFGDIQHWKFNSYDRELIIRYINNQFDDFKINKILNQAYKIIDEADIVECLTSPSDFIRESKKLLEKCKETE